jgi:hypothetical protein
MSGWTMMTIVALVTAVALPTDAGAQSCPPELAQARAALERARSTAMTEQQLPREAAGARQQVEAPRGQEVQAPRGQEVQAPRGQEVQAPRGQEVQAPRGQEVQAPRGQEVQAPRGQEVQAPRGQEIQAPRSQETGSKTERAAALINESDVACRQGNMTLSAEKARAVLEMLR